MKHPNSDIQKRQDQFLDNCSDEDRPFHAQLFRIGNAAYRYHQKANADEEFTKKYFFEWLEGLPSGIKKDMEIKGFEACKSILSFTRYVNERRDIGMDEWMKEHLSQEDYTGFKNPGAADSIL